RLPTGIKRIGELISGKRRPIGPLPRWPLRVALDVCAFVFQTLEKRLPRRVECLRVGLVAGMEVFDIVGIAAIQKRGAGESGIGVWARHQRLQSKRGGNKPGKGTSAGPAELPLFAPAGRTFSLFNRSAWQTKDETMNSHFHISASVLPSRAGDGATLMPAASMAAILDSASPLPPAMIAPAWPMRRPGGAGRPAIKPTIGFLAPPLASS